MPSSLKEPTRRRTFREETAATPLCVDLDGTLIRTDLLFESVLLLLRENFLYIFCLPFWLLAGKAAFKRRLSSKVTINPSELPYNEPLLTWIHKQRKLGRRTVLATGSNRRVAEQIADHLDCFDEVIASDDNVNLTSKLKSATLVRKFGQNAFDYAGNSRAGRFGLEGLQSRYRGSRLGQNFVVSQEHGIGQRGFPRTPGRRANLVSRGARSSMDKKPVSCLAAVGVSPSFRHYRGQKRCNPFFRVQHLRLGNLYYQRSARLEGRP